MAVHLFLSFFLDMEENLSDKLSKSRHGWWSGATLSLLLDYVKYCYLPLNLEKGNGCEAATNFLHNFLVYFLENVVHESDEAKSMSADRFNCEIQCRRIA